MCNPDSFFVILAIKYPCTVCVRVFRKIAMTESLFESNYPKENYTYVRKSFRTKGTMGQTEIEVFDIVSKETGDIVLVATRTEHTNLRGLDTTVSWDW